MQEEAAPIDAQELKNQPKPSDTGRTLKIHVCSDEGPLTCLIHSVPETVTVKDIFKLTNYVGAFHGICETPGGEFLPDDYVIESDAVWIRTGWPRRGKIMYVVAVWIFVAIHVAPLVYKISKKLSWIECGELYLLLLLLYSCTGLTKFGFRK